MTELPGDIVKQASEQGGILGLLIVVILGFMVWYIHSSRKYHAVKEREEAKDRAEQNAILAEERKEWREAIERNTAAFHNLEKALQSKPCLRPRTTRTRETDFLHDE